MALPFNQEFQRSFLALLIRNEKYLVDYASRTNRDYFTYEQYKVLWDIISTYYLEYKKPPTKLAIEEELRKIFTDDYEVSFYVYEYEQLLELPVEDERYILSEVDDYLTYVSLVEVIKHAFLKLEKNEKMTPQELIDMVRRAMLKTNEQTDIIDFKNLQQRVKGETEVLAVPTGFSKVDSALGGGVPYGQLAIIGAHTRIGKTMFLINVAYNAAKRGHKVLYITLEQDVYEIANRLDLVHWYYCTGEESMELNRYLELFDKFPISGELKLKGFPTKRVSPAELEAFLYKLELVEKFKPELLIVDYGALLKGEVKKERWEAIGEIYENLRRIASEHQIAIWTAVQLHRELARLEYKKVKVAHVDMIYWTRDSSMIAEVSDKFLILVPEKVPAETEGKGFEIRHYALVLAKTRAGTEGAVIELERYGQALLEENKEAKNA